MGWVLLNFRTSRLSIVYAWLAYRIRNRHSKDLEEDDTFQAHEADTLAQTIMLSL